MKLINDALQCPPVYNNQPPPWQLLTAICPVMMRMHDDWHYPPANHLLSRRGTQAMMDINGGLLCPRHSRCTNRNHQASPHHWRTTPLRLFPFLPPHQAHRLRLRMKSPVRGKQQPRLQLNSLLWLLFNLRKNQLLHPMTLLNGISFSLRT